MTNSDSPLSDYSDGYTVGFRDGFLNGREAAVDAVKALIPPEVTDAESRVASIHNRGVEMGRVFAYEEMAQSDTVSEIHASTIYATGVTQGLDRAADVVADMASKVDAIAIVTALNIAAEHLRAEARRQ